MLYTNKYDHIIALLLLNITISTWVNIMSYRSYVYEDIFDDNMNESETL